MKSFPIRVRVEIDAPAAAVWARASDHGNGHTWVKPAVIELITPGEPTNGVGATRRVSFPARRTWPSVDEDIVHYEEGQCFHYRVVSGMGGLHAHLGKVIVDDLGDGKSALRWEIDFEFKPWHPLRWFAGTFIKMFGAVIAEACAELGRQLEAA